MTIKLGQLIRTLERENPKADVRFMGYVRPTGLDSWRGVYSELALGYTNDGNNTTVAELLAWCREAVGKTYTGYKGGHFVMSEQSEVWIDNYGEYTETPLSGVRGNEYVVRLLSDWRE